MNPIIITQRLELTLITTAERGTRTFESIHELRSNKESSWWSLHGPSKTREDTELALQHMLALPDIEGSKKVHRYPYAVHEKIEDSTTRFIGLVTLRSLSCEECKFPPRETHGSTNTRLSLEMAYMFLPTSWSKGFATESITAILKSCKSATGVLWAPLVTVIVRAIVNNENVPSQRVMQKCGMGEPEVVEFEGSEFFIAGKWRTKHRLFIYAREFIL